MATKIETGMRWDNIVVAMESEEWEDNPDGDMQCRRIYLGTLINPSGKYYLPFACSNLNPCPQCGGRGKIRKAKARLLKKLTNASKRRREKHDGDKSFWKLPFEERKRLLSIGSTNRYVLKNEFRLAVMEPTCERCGGSGSHEAHDDEIFWELLEEEAGVYDYSIESGEGDPCDTFVCEYRDKPEEDEEDDPDEECPDCDELPPGQFCGVHTP